MAQKKRGKKYTKIILGIVLAGFILVLIAGLLLFSPIIKKKTILYIPTHADFSQVCDSLQTQEGVGNLFVFKSLAKYKNYDQNIKAGRYVLDRGMRNLTLLRKLKSGNQDPVKLKLNTVRTLEQLAGRISTQMEIDSLGLLKFFRNDEFAAQYKIGDSVLNTQRLIACFIPNTYFVNWNLDAQAIFERMFKEQQIFWNAKSSNACGTDEELNRKERAQRMGLNPLDVITIASIVEEETHFNPEKPQVASVYLNRLRKGMLLQADPTVKFANGDFALRRIRGEHTKIESPYNTYRYKGLPPGPICMPSISSIDAVLCDEKTPYLYFCAKSDFSGAHAFASNFAEHQINARAYHKALNRRDIK